VGGGTAAVFGIGIEPDDRKHDTTSTLACALTFRFGAVSDPLETPLIVGGGGGGGGCGTADAKKLSNIAAGLDTAAAELIFLSSLIAFSGTGLLRADFSRTF